jgi:hypothetical protein
VDDGLVRESGGMVAQQQEQPCAPEGPAVELVLALSAGGAAHVNRR